MLTKMDATRLMTPGGYILLEAWAPAGFFKILIVNMICA
jgi:hypothetical protein